MLEITDFRGILKGSIDLMPLSVLVGENGSGKSTVLEAIRLESPARSILISPDMRNIPRWMVGSMNGGDGSRRLNVIAKALVTFDRVLLEEPECFQHPSSILRLALQIWDAIHRGVRVALSTHSLELLNHIFLAEIAQLERSAVFFTWLKDGELTAVKILGRNAAERLDAGEDLRQ